MARVVNVKNVKVLGIPQAIKNIESYVNRKTGSLQAVVREAAKDIKEDAKRRAPKDLGKLQDGIKFRVVKNKKSIVARIVSEADYSAFVEFGTSPHFPPWDELEGWAQRHGFGEGGGFLVARSISKKGTPAQPFMHPAFFNNKNTFIKAVRRVMKSP